MNVFTQLFGPEHGFDVEQMRFDHISRGTPKKHHLRVFGAVGESAGDRDRFSRRSITVQLVLARTNNLTRRNEIRLIELQQEHGDFRIVQNAAVSLPHQFFQLWNSCAFGHYRRPALELNVAIRLNGHGFVQLRRKRKGQFNYVALIEPVKRTAFPRQGWTPFRNPSAVRFTGLCARRASGFDRSGRRLTLGDGFHRSLRYYASGKSQHHKGHRLSDDALPALRSQHPPHKLHLGMAKVTPTPRIHKTWKVASTKVGTRGGFRNWDFFSKPKQTQLLESFAPPNKPRAVVYLRILGEVSIFLSRRHEAVLPELSSPLPSTKY